METQKPTYFPTYTIAQLTAQELPEKWQQWYRIVLYTPGYAIQLHRSGPYVGDGVDIETHSCRWCPSGVQH